MTAFRDSGHSWWQQCSSCSMAWHVGMEPDDPEEDFECKGCGEPSHEAMCDTLRGERDAALKNVTALEVGLSDAETLRRRLEKTCEAAEELAASCETDAKTMRHERDAAQKRAETYLSERDAAMRQVTELRAMLKETEISFDQARRQAWAAAKRSAPHDEQESIQAKADADASTRAQQSSHPKNATGADVAAARRDTHTLWLASCEEAMAGKDWEGLRQLRSIGPLLISG